MESQQVRAKFYAQNKYLLVQVIEEQEEDTTNIVLPEGYKKKQNPFKLGVILNAQDNSEFAQHLGSYIVFPSNAVEEISVQGLNVTMVPSHAVYGVLKNDDSAE